MTSLSPQSIVIEAHFLLRFYLSLRPAVGARLSYTAPTLRIQSEGLTDLTCYRPQIVRVTAISRFSFPPLGFAACVCGPSVAERIAHHITFWRPILQEVCLSVRSQNPSLLKPVYAFAFAYAYAAIGTYLRS